MKIISETELNWNTIKFKKLETDEGPGFMALSDQFVGFSKIDYYYALEDLMAKWRGNKEYWKGEENKVLDKLSKDIKTTND